MIFYIRSAPCKGSYRKGEDLYIIDGMGEHGHGIYVDIRPPSGDARGVGKFIVFSFDKINKFPLFNDPVPVGIFTGKEA